MINDQIVKVVNNGAGHSYRVGAYYKVSKIPASSSNSLKLEEIIKVQGITPLPTGSTIYITDCEFIDIFTANEEFASFLKVRLDQLTATMIGSLATLVSFKAGLKMMADFGSKEEYVVSRISECKETLSSSEDEGCKKIVELLAHLA